MMYQLIISALVFIPGIMAFALGKKKLAFWLLLFSACVIRLMMIGLDPFLHNWDERFHAAVAKNMMQYPFKPMLRMQALLPYDPADWCCNYVWVHKQPLFLWQMALSLKAFGINTIALRLPSAIMGTFTTFCIYEIARIWSRNEVASYLSALLFATSYYSLELCSGRMSLDHNDIMMGGYVTAGIWAFCKYSEDKRLKWAVIAGVFVGCAVLVKWLTALLVFGGWGIWLITNPENRNNFKLYKHFAVAVLSCVIVFLPWQIYIRLAFPVESAASYAYNYKHIFEDLGHPGSAWTHLNFMTTAYSGPFFLLMLVLGAVLSLRIKSFNRSLSFAMVSMYVVVYAFFSLIVATKMPGLTFPVSAIGYIWIGTCLQFISSNTNRLLSKIPTRFIPISGSIIMFALILHSYRPDKIAKARLYNSPERISKIHNTEIYRQLDKYVTPDEIILNCKSFEDTEVRFWQPNNAYHWYPKQPQVDSLLNLGYKLVAFQDHNDQGLPDYISQNPRIRVINLQLQ